jgi:cytoskeletal protein CcmA (bactofilin family)
MAKTIEVESKAINIIASGTTITGDINSDGDLRIEGSIIGNINTKGKVVVGITGKIAGEITCKNFDLSGKVEGKVNAEKLLSLKSTANILGDINAGKLAVEPGAVFTGTCKMKENGMNPSVTLNTGKKV